jgi:hypothetical protein
MKQIISMLVLLLLSMPTLGQAKINGWWETLETRHAYALKLQRNFGALYDQIPTLSPSEEQWLKTEYDDTIAANGDRYTQRAVSATRTRVWSIRVAKPHALKIKTELAIFATPLNRAQETREWTEIAALLMDHEFWQAVEDLRHRGVIDKQHLEFLGEFPGPTAGLWAQQILNEIVVPYFDVAH